MKVIVLGSGVIGVASAYFLAQDGHEVTVIDKAKEVGMGCSYANGGQLSYSHIETWAQKNSFKSLIKALVSHDSYLSINKDLLNKNFRSWIYDFYKNSSSKRCFENSYKIHKINSFSKLMMQHLIKTEKGLNFQYKNEGILHFYRDKNNLENEIKNLQVFNKIDHSPQILSPEECIKKEPNLIQLFDDKKLAGGIFYEQDCTGNSYEFVKNLKKICVEKYGVNFEHGVEVKNLLTNYKKITGINSSNGVYVADKYVYAMASGATSLLSGIGINTKIYPVKGYSISIKCNEGYVAPNLSMTDSENKVVYSRLGNIFRVAGTIEFGGDVYKSNKKHIQYLQKIVKKTFSDYGNINQATEWQGFRPFRPNSTPLICQVKKYDNLYLNAGHGSLGWTMACGSGRILADLISDQKIEEFSFLDDELKN